MSQENVELAYRAFDAVNRRVFIIGIFFPLFWLIGALLPPRQ